MSLTDFASLSAAISGIAVTLSVIYLALQVHQNTRHTRALIHQGRAARTTQVALGVADTDITTAMLLANGGTPTPELVAFNQVNMVATGVLAHWEDVFDQHEVGLLSDDQFGSWKGSVIATFRMQATRGIWNQWKADRPDTNTKFKACVDSIAATVAPAPPPTPTVLQSPSEKLP